ncbi:hypothetical protein CEQ90_01075 [Lewinellaceae bacterium SD302]|nr:hypothetical protein CEQ90_01075 [Lewinellaceae bacterium SD302]
MKALKYLLLLLFLLANESLTGQLTNLLKDPASRGTHPSEEKLFAYAERHLDSLRENDLLYEDSSLTAYLYDITDRLLPGQRALTPWELYVTTSLAPNASALADGHLFINAGLLLRFDHEAQLAFILAHELAHYLYRHSAAQWEFNSGLNNTYSSRNKKRHGLFSQSLEQDADEIAVLLYAQAGYPPEQLDEALRRMPPEMNYGGFLSFLFGVSDEYRSHPRTPERVAHVNEFARQKEFTERYEGRDYLAITEQIRMEARKSLAKNSSGGTLPQQIRMVDSLLLNLPAEEYDDPFAWDMRLQQADACLKLLLLSETEANRLMVIDKRRAEYRAESSKEEFEASVLLHLRKNKKDYPQMIAAVRDKFHELLKKLTTYTRHAPEVDRLEGILLFEEEEYANAIILLEKYLQNTDEPFNARLIRKMIRTSKEELNNKRKKKRSN